MHGLYGYFFLNHAYKVVLLPVNTDAKYKAVISSFIPDKTTYPNDFLEV